MLQIRNIINTTKQIGFLPNIITRISEKGGVVMPPTVTVNLYVPL